MAGKRTSVYLTDELAAAVKDDGRPLAVLIRDGLAIPALRTITVPDDLPARVREQVAELLNLAPPDALPPAEYPWSKPGADVIGDLRGIRAKGRTEALAAAGMTEADPVAESSRKPRKAPRSETGQCPPHPSGRVHKGLCGACGTHVG